MTALALACSLGAPAGAWSSGFGVAVGGGGFGQLAARGGVALSASPYRWQAIQLGGRHPETVVERVERRGGEVSRRWRLDGEWGITAPAFDGAGAGLAGDESVLVLTRFHRPPFHRRRATELAILETEPHRPGRPVVHRVRLPGEDGVYAVAPDGSTLFLTRVSRPLVAPIRFTIQPYDLRRRRLLPAAAIRGNGEILSGLPTARIQDVSGHRVYTLYLDGRRHPYVLALDTAGRALRRVELPRLPNPRRAFARLDLRNLAPAARRPPAAIGQVIEDVGRSTRGRPIELVHSGNFDLPGRLLVFGCIHGDECGASALQPLQGGCPDPDVNVFLVPNLDPDGSASKSRLNGRGVDLNRNFPARWRPIGELGGLEYAGPRPFSEPEARLAARLVRRIGPRVTIWFHQDWADRAYVRAWGQSAPAARHFAHLAGIPFKLMPWLAGTAPNWQNHRFPGTASFVVETPRGRLGDSLRARLTTALSGLGEEVAGGG